MKVAHIMDTLSIGGTEVSLLALIRAMDNVESVVCHVYPGDELSEDFEAAGARVVSLEAIGKYSLLSSSRRFKGLLEREKPDLVHAHLFRSGMVARLSAPSLKIPLVDSFVSDSYGASRARRLTPSRRVKLRAIQLLDWLTAARVTAFVANSESARDANCRALGLPAAKVEVIPRGRHPGDFGTPTRSQRLRLRADLGFDSDTFLLLHVGRLVEAKGHVDLIDAMPLVIGAVPSAHLLIVGDGPLRNALEERIRSAGLDRHVTLLGARRDIPDLLASCDLFVFPSHYEGHPGTIIEAMLSTKPIVATAIPPIGETLEDGASALLVPVGDHLSLSRAIVRIAGDPVLATRLSSEARKLALARYTAERMARRHLDLYERILRRPAA